MSRLYITKEARKLGTTLRERGIELEFEYWDGHKHVDIFIPSAGLCIEIDGPKHYTDAKQIFADLERAHYSDDDGQRTMHIPNEIITAYFDKIVDAIAKVVLMLQKKPSNDRV